MSDIRTLNAGNFDIKSKYAIHLQCMQNDNVVLKINIFNNSEIVDLTGYHIRLKAMKSDQVPLIQNTEITIDNGNEITIKCDAQLTVVAGTVMAEMQFINNDTFEKTSTYYIYIEVKPDVLGEGDGTISVATCTLLDEIDTKLSEIENIGTVLDEAKQCRDDLITLEDDGNKIHDDIQNSITSGGEKIKEIEAACKSGEIRINEITNAIIDATSAKNSLIEVNKESTTLKDSLVEANVKAEQNIEALNSFGNATQVTQDVTSLKEEVATARGGKENLNARIELIEESLENIEVVPKISHGNLIPASSELDFTFYVDYVNGNDKNDGLTSGTPFKTLPRAWREIPMIFVGSYTIKLMSNYSAISILERRIPYGIYAKIIITSNDTSNPIVISENVTFIGFLGKMGQSWSFSYGMIELNNLIFRNQQVVIRGCRGISVQDCKSINEVAEDTHPLLWFEGSVGCINNVEVKHANSTAIYACGADSSVICGTVKGGKSSKLFSANYGARIMYAFISSATYTTLQSTAYGGTVEKIE